MAAESPTPGLALQRFNSLVGSGYVVCGSASGRIGGPHHEGAIMRACRISWVAGLMFLVVTGDVIAQVPEVTIDLPALRANVANQLLNRADPRSPLLDHIWKSNGGALILRDPTNSAAQALAARLAGLIEYNPETATFAWPIVGFTDRTSIRFPPGVLWELFLPYLTERRVEEADLQAMASAFIAHAEAHPAVVDPLVPPVGLTLPAELLLRLTGYGGSRLFVYSASNCFDVAIKCYAIGRFDDARVLLSHALAQREDARYYYVRGTIEMLTGYPDDAHMSALGFNARPEPLPFAAGYVYERINGPPAIQFRHLAAYLAGRS
jgi:hypothetical protein